MVSHELLFGRFLASDARVQTVCQLTSLSIDTVVGKIFRFLCWIEPLCKRGTAEVDPSHVDALFDCPGFVSALVISGFVESTLLSITILPGIATSARLQRTEPRKKVVALDPYFPEELDTPEFRALWDEWLAHRKAKKVSLTPQTLHRQMNMLRGLGLERAMACLNNSLTNGYMGLFEPRMPGVQKPKQEEDENTRLADLLKQQAEKRKAAQQEVERVRRERIGTPVTARGTADHGKATESR